MKDIFPQSNSSNYDIESRSTFTTRSIKTVYYGTTSLSFLAPKVWKLIPNNIKSFENLPKLIRAIKNWKPDVCLMYADIGFADSTFHKSGLCSECSFNFHFCIY